MLFDYTTLPPYCLVEKLQTELDVSSINEGECEIEIF